jgi:hypothetical protein
MRAARHSSNHSVCNPSQVLQVYQWGDPDLNANDRPAPEGQAVVTLPRT